MSCYKYKILIDKMHDGRIDNNELQSVLDHIKECESCRTYYSVMENMLKDLSSLEEKPLPEGFHNKLHFALKRETEKPSMSRLSLSRGFRVAAVGAFSVLLVFAAMSILPGRGYKQDAANSVMDEAPMEMPQAEALSVEETYLDAEPATAQARDGINTDEAGELAEEEASAYGEKNQADLFSSMEHGDTIVLVLDVDDIDTAYADIVQFVYEPLYDAGWMLEDFIEPEIYRQIRTVTSVDQAQITAGRIAAEYSSAIVSEVIIRIEYDDYAQETADLQNAGYVLIVLK